eukprot:5879709-Ditylum_brightwellii.AAC.1
MVLGNLIKKQQGQVDFLRKHCKDKFDQLDGVKRTCWDSNDKYDEYMDGLGNQIHDTQSQGAPLQRDSLATTTKGLRVSQTPD